MKCHKIISFTLNLFRFCLFFQKIIERHVYDSLFHYWRLHKLIYEGQPGFRANYSTETALIKITDMLLKNIDMNQINGLLLVDYRKAYDLVDHSILLVNMKCYGLYGATLSWFNSYQVCIFSKTH